MIPLLIRRRDAAAALACACFLLIGWSGLVIPSLVRQVEATYGQTDAGMGLFYFVYALAYAGGSVLGGFATERIGRRTVLVGGMLVHGIGLLVQGTIPTWGVFLLAGLPRGLGGGILDGGANGLILDLFPGSRGRALNAAHLFFSLGALGAPFAVAALSGSGVGWEALVVATGLASFPIALLLAVTDLADGRRTAAGRTPAGGPGAAGSPARERGFRGAPVALVALGIAIACYVATEMGVSNWLVRFLEAAPVALATSALGLYWAGLTLGRLLGARLADRFDHLRLGIATAAATSIALAAAVLVPSLPLSIACFGLVGVASGPIYPLIMAIGGERFPDRTAAVSGLLSAAAVAGSVVYPPLMGLISVGAGLPVAMLGTALVGLGSVGALLAVGPAEGRGRGDRSLTEAA